ncbi:sensor histidine kinase [Utexia brackfieldae]|uniref:LytS/YhcK type 5TM receptor domain-containing protein n=1 Tax=Utexia brackfieldae TaxID=3074108 RepID=UPI00370D7252
MDEITLVFQLLQQMCIYLVVAYLLSKTPIFIPLMQVTVHAPHKLLCYVIFSIFCIMGTYLGLHFQDSIANTRAIGAVLGGLLGGPLVGIAVGFTGGIHRYMLGGMTAESCMLSTIFAGLVGGVVHVVLRRQGRIDRLYNPITVGCLTMVVEILQMLIILLVAQPYAEALNLVKNIAAPMIITNSIGGAMFMRILLDRRAMFEKYTSAFSAKALKIAASTEGILLKGFNQENSLKVAQIIYQELDIGAVAITDCEKLLAFIGIGDDHHLSGTPISSPQTLQVIEHNHVEYVDGIHKPYCCSIDKNCRLGSTLVIPLRGENQKVIGTIKLYEAKNTLFSSINRTLGEGIASLLSAQILAGQNERYKQLLFQSEIKLLHAQVNPHFLFNALNTLVAVIRRNGDQASYLVQNMSTFFRKNLKRPEEVVSLKDEIEHVTAYLEIEKARFMERLQIYIAIPESLMMTQLPAFSLQPIVENAIKHGTSHLLETGEITISAYQYEPSVMIEVTDNAGRYDAKQSELNKKQGLGMNLVDKRIKIRYGEDYGIEVACQENLSTTIRIRLPQSVE